MERKVKYDYTFKLECVELVLQKHYSEGYVSKLKQIPRWNIRKWVSFYKTYGEIALLPRVSQNYSKEFKFKVLKVIEKNKYSFPVFFSLSPLPKPLENKIIPSTYVLNKKGRIIVDSKVSANWNSDGFRKVLDELVK